MNENLIERNCPLCRSNNSDLLIKLNPEYFINSNPSLDLDVIKECGIMNLLYIPLMRCKKCEFVYTKFVLNDYWLGIVYNKIISADKSKKKIFTHSKKLSNLQIWYALYSYFLTIESNTDDKIYLLEYGCGWGDFLSIAASYGVECIGIETDKRKLDYCSQKGLTVFPDIDRINPVQRFNVFLSNQVFEHLDDPLTTLLKIKTVLANDIIGYISVPNYPDEVLQQSIRDFRNIKLTDKNLNSWEHVNYFSPKKLWDFLNMCEFEVFDISNGKLIHKKNLKGTSCNFRLKK